MSKTGPFPVDQTFDLGTVRFTAEDIIGFASQFDFQPFHLDEAAAARTHFGALAASGWHTAAEFSAMLNAAFAARPELRAFQIGPWKKIDSLRWKRPVRKGDTIAFSATFRETDSSGLVHLSGRGTTLDGEPVYELEAQLSVPSLGSPRK
ncbi:MaoC/PaaZ C-terminal domain-containing protein [Tepidamorphus sp. 3E244]|uniref:MaoC/PaaZ C-terminal domain-containing protein n=1 Tax=Tepidamorphus sp. 3E244 TaxID=3385498 RepID=UPI0038FC7E69